MTMEESLLKLLNGEFSSLSLSFNEEIGPDYTNVLDVVTNPRGYDFDIDWVSEEEKNKACELKRIWTLH